MEATSNKQVGETRSDDGTSSLPRWLEFGKIKSLLILFLFTLGLTANTVRIISKYQIPAKKFDTQNQGYCDFHNGVYFPADAFRKGLSPYGKPYADQYNTPRPIPFFSPVTLIMHVPFTFFDLKTAELLYFAWLLGLVILLSWMTIRFSGIKIRWQHVLLVATFILFSRAGHNTFFTGYFTFELIIGTLVALQYGKTRPHLSAAGLLLASSKPTYVIPLGIVMLARGNIKAVILGAALSATVAAIGFGWLASNTAIPELVEGIKQGQQEHLDDPSEFPIYTWMRVDLPAIIAKWTDWNPGEALQLAMMCLLIAPLCFVIWKSKNNLDDQEGASTIVGMICCLAVIVTFYHHIYDMLLVIVPCFAIAAVQQNWHLVARLPRLIVLFCALFPLLNYTSASFFLHRFAEQGALTHKMITSVNGLLAVIGLTVACLIALHANNADGSPVSNATTAA